MMLVLKTEGETLTGMTGHDGAAALRATAHTGLSPGRERTYPPRKSTLRAEGVQSPQSPVRAAAARGPQPFRPRAGGRGGHVLRSSSKPLTRHKAGRGGAGGRPGSRSGRRDSPPTARPGGRRAHASPKPPPRAPRAAGVTVDGRLVRPEGCTQRPEGRDRRLGLSRPRGTARLASLRGAAARGGTRGGTKGRSEERCSPPACPREPPGPPAAAAASHKGFAPRPPRDASSPGRRHRGFHGHVAQQRPGRNRKPGRWPKARPPLRPLVLYAETSVRRRSSTWVSPKLPGRGPLKGWGTGVLLGPGFFLRFPFGSSIKTHV